MTPRGAIPHKGAQVKQREQRALRAKHDEVGANLIESLRKERGSACRSGPIIVKGHKSCDLSRQFALRVQSARGAAR